MSHHGLEMVKRRVYNVRERLYDSKILIPLSKTKTASYRVYKHTFYVRLLAWQYNILTSISIKCVIIIIVVTAFTVTKR